MELRFLCSSPPALAGDQLIPVLNGPNDDRLEHAALGDRRGKLIDRLIVENLTWLRWIRPDTSNFYRPDAALRNGIGTRNGRRLAN
jgi:hypothetical protein